MENKYRHTNTTVSLINYHFVFCPRYRRKIFLIPNVEERFKELVKIKCKELDIEIIAIECDKDHSHMFLNCLPTLSPSDIMQQIKGYNTFEAKASQFNHFDGTYTKKSLSQRWNDFNGIKIQRDIYSAFLIMNISDDLKNFNINKCNERFNNFYRLHNLEVNRLTGKNNLSSIAI